MTSPDGRFDEVALNDYMARNIVQELRRIDGVGRVQLFGAEQAMRIWVDPGKLAAYGLTISEVTQAIEQQNVQIAPGRQRGDPACHRHRRVRRHDQRHPAGHLLRAGLFCLRHRHPGAHSGLAGTANTAPIMLTAVRVCWTWGSDEYAMHAWHHSAFLRRG
nr:efflux RND transporter permease subunit [Aeromonas caviae]